MREHQGNPEKILGAGEQGHYEGEKLKNWADKALRLFRWIQTVRRVKSERGIPHYPSRIPDDSHLPKHLRNVPEQKPNTVIPAILNAGFSRPAGDRAVRINIILAEGTTEIQRENAIRELRREPSLWK